MINNNSASWWLLVFVIGMVAVPVVNAQTTPTATLVPGELNFNGVNVGATSQPLALTITNTSVLSFNMEVTEIQLSDPGIFEIGSGGSCGNLPFNLARSESCTLNIIFKPIRLGDFSAALQVITASSFNINPPSVTLRGTGSAIPVRFGPSTINFGEIGVGNTSASRLITITNLGTTRITIDADEAVVTGGASTFSRSSRGTCGTSSFSINPNQSCTLGVVFTPRGAASFRGFFRIITDKPYGFEPAQVALDGTGVLGSPSTVIISDNFELAN